MKMKTRILKVSDLWDLDLVLDRQYCLFYKWYDEYDLQSEPIYPVIHDIVGDDYESFDMDYFTNHSADKYLSPMIVRMIKKICDDNNYDFYSLVNGTMSSTTKTAIIAELTNSNTYRLLDIIYKRFSTKWKKLWDAMNTAYNPLENYDMEEIRTPDIKKTEDTTITSETKTEMNVNGFNSGDSVPSNDSSGNQKDIVDKDTTETGTEKTTRHGNIGVTSSQQLLESEINVRRFDVIKSIYNDIDSILCMKIY